MKGVYLFGPGQFSFVIFIIFLLPVPINGLGDLLLICDYVFVSKLSYYPTPGVETPSVWIDALQLFPIINEG